MLPNRLTRGGFFRRLGFVAVALLGLSALRSATPGPEVAAGVTDPVTGERIGELTYGLTPARLLDTRAASTVDNQYVNTGKLANRNLLVLPVRDRGGVPASATGVFVNVTVSDPTTGGYLSIWPEGAWPGTSNLNFSAGQTIANFAFVALGTDGAIRIQVSDANAHVVVDAVAFTSDLPTI